MSRSKPLGRVAIIDDDPLALEFLILHLGAAGFEALVAQDGPELLDLLRGGKARIVIADWIMPKMDGLELCKAIRSLKGLDYVYFIMLTIRHKRALLLEAFKAGVDDFISKPVYPGELVARLQVGMRMIQIQEQLKKDARSVARLNKELTEANKRFRRLSVTDDLTGLPNRRYALMRLREEWALANRSGQPFACALIDVDRFKHINDRHGHAIGDAVLRQISADLGRAVRGGDAVCRFGGDEFLIIFRNHDVRAAVAGAERCRCVVANQTSWPEGLETPVTISIGVAQNEPGMSGLDDLVQSADQALYAAKHSGKNSVWVWETNGSDSLIYASQPQPVNLLAPSAVAQDANH